VAAVRHGVAARPLPLFDHNFTGSAGSVSQSFIELPWAKQHVLQPLAHSFAVDKRHSVQCRLLSQF